MAKGTQGKDSRKEPPRRQKLNPLAHALAAVLVTGMNGTAGAVEVAGDDADPIALSGNTTYTVTNAGDSFTFSGPISGAYAIAKDGAGALWFSGNNTYSGGTRLGAGTLGLGSDTAFGTYDNAAGSVNGQVNVTGNGTIRLDDDRAIRNRFAIGSAGQLTFDLAGRTLTIDGVENKSSAAGSDVGGAITIDANGAAASQLLFVGNGRLAIRNSWANSGGAIGASVTGYDGTSVRLDLRGLASASFESNHAAGDGGGVYAAVFGLPTTSDVNSIVTFGNRVTFIDNRAEGNGGGVYSYAFARYGGIASVTLGDQATFIDNSAGGSGGGVFATSFGYGAHNWPGFVTLGNQATFIGNRAEWDGGGIQSGTVTLGDRATFRDNSAGGYGGAIAAWPSNDDPSMTMGRMVTFSGNRAGESGGAILISTDSIWDGDPAVFGDRALFGANQAGVNGGAVYINSSLVLGGNTLFRGNLAGGSGGAIHIVYGGIFPISLALDTTAGDIAFTGNRSGVAFDGSGTPDPATGTPNSLHLDGDTTLSLKGGHNLYFDDPINASNWLGGNTLAKSGSGFVQFVGDSVLNTGGQAGGAVSVDAGTFRLADVDAATPSSFTTGGNDATFTVAAGATLAGQGTIAAEKGFIIAGTVSPDSDRFAVPEYVDMNHPEATATDYNYFKAGNTTVAADKRIGTLNLVGDVALDGATLAIDFDGAAHDRIAVSGGVSFATANGQNRIVASGGTNGTYDILTAGSDMTLIPGDFETISGIGADGYSYARGSAIQLKEGDATVLQFKLDTTQNLTLTWTGANGGAWSNTSTTAANWTDRPGGTANETHFLNGDSVVFGNNAGEQAIAIAAGGVTAGNMTLAGNYAYSGGPITASDVNIGAGGALGLTVGATPALVARSVDFNGTGRLNISGYVVGGLDDTPQTLVRTTDGILRFNESVTISNQSSVDFLAAKAVVSGNDIQVKTDLRWTSTDPDWQALGNFTIGAGSSFTLGGTLGDTTANLSPGWDGKTLTKLGDGTLTLTGSNTYSGGTKVAGGTLSLGAPGAASAGTIDLSTGATLETTYDGTLGNLISGSGTYVKNGAGTLTLAADNGAFAGLTRIDAGVLIVDHRLGGDLTVNGGGTLAGNGTVAGDVTVNSSGIASPGGGQIGTLNVGGNLTFSAGSYYDVEVHPTDFAQSDRIAIAGTAALDGATVRHIGFDESRGEYSPLGSWTILRADGGLAGTRFAGVQSDFAFLDAALEYSANEVRLKLGRNQTDFAQYAHTPNERAVASGLQSLSGVPGSSLYNQVVGLKAQSDLAGLYDQMSGEIHASTQSALLDYDREFGRALRQRLSSRDWKPGSSPLWVAVEGSTGKTDGTGNTAEVKNHSTGISLGAEVHQDDWTLGAAYRYGDGKVKQDARYSKTTIDSHTLALYAVKQGGPWQMKVGGTYSWHSIDGKRRIVDPAFQQTLKSSYDANSAQVFGELAYASAVNAGATLEPYVGLAWNTVRNDRFHERGGNASLNGRAKTNDNVSSALGMRLKYQGTAATWLEADGYWQHLYGDRNAGGEYTFMGGQYFAIEGAPMARDAFGVRLGAAMRLMSAARISIYYDGLFGNGTRNNAGLLKFDYVF